jgi:hypothetical protein
VERRDCSRGSIMIGPLPADITRPYGRFSTRRSFGLVWLDIFACNTAREFGSKPCHPYARSRGTFGYHPE